MALYSMASNINTKQTIWVSTNVVKNRPQLNSHREDDFGRCYQREGIDGYSAAELADLHTSYVGNDWESKYESFMEEWSGVEFTNTVAC